MNRAEAKSLSAATLKQILRLAEMLSRDLPMDGESSIAIVRCEECGRSWPEYRKANHRSDCFINQTVEVIREELVSRGEHAS